MPKEYFTDRTFVGSKLSAEEIREYYQRGWLLKTGLFQAHEVQKMLEAFERLYQTAQKLKYTQDYQGAHFVLAESSQRVIVKRVVWAGGAEKYLLEVGADPRILSIVGSLLNTHQVEHILNQAHFKMPKDSVVFPWHQDIRHRDKGNGEWTDVDGRGSYVQTLLAIDPVQPEGGPVIFVEGSSQWGRIDSFKPIGEYESGIDEKILEGQKIVTPLMQPGDVVFFGPYTVHGSGANMTDRPRRVLINGYAYPGANHRKYPGDGSGRMLKIP